MFGIPDPKNIDKTAGILLCQLSQLAQIYSCHVDFHLILIYLLTVAPYFDGSTHRVRGAEEWMVFLGGHPAKYWQSTIVCAVCECVCVCVLLCQVFDIETNLGDWATIYFHQLTPLTSHACIKPRY